MRQCIGAERHADHRTDRHDKDIGLVGQPPRSGDETRGHHTVHHQQQRRRDLGTDHRTGQRHEDERRAETRKATRQPCDQGNRNNGEQSLAGSVSE